MKSPLQPQPEKTDQEQRRGRNQTVDAVKDTAVPRDNPGAVNAPRTNERSTRFTPEYAAIHRSILTGLFGHIARREERNLYRLGGHKQGMVFPGSGLFKKPPDWVMTMPGSSSGMASIPTTQPVTSVSSTTPWRTRWSRSAPFPHRSRSS